MIGWIKYFFILLLSGAFLVFGIQLLIAAYKLNDPFLFIVSFFFFQSDYTYQCNTLFWLYLQDDMVSKKRAGR